MTKTKIKRIISLILILSVCISAFSFPMSTQALRETQADENVRLKYCFALFYNKPPLKGGTFQFIFDFWILDMIFAFSSIFKSDITILGEDGLYYFIEFNGERGYVLKSFISGKFDGNVLITNTNHLSIYNGESRDITITQTNMSNSNLIKWTSSNKNIAECTGKGKTCTVKAKGVGKAKVTAELNGKTATCYIYVLDKWNYGWQTTAKEKVVLRQAPKSGSSAIATIPAGDTVLGLADMHSNNKYCYVKYKSGDTYKWGYVLFTSLSSQG